MNPVLKIFDHKKETELYTDIERWSRFTSMGRQSVQYMSKKTTNAEKKKHSYELEVLAIIEALKKFRYYFY